jgi:hypothetical protein
VEVEVAIVLVRHMPHDSVKKFCFCFCLLKGPVFIHHSNPWCLKTLDVGNTIRVMLELQTAKNQPVLVAILDLPIIF